MHTYIYKTHVLEAKPHDQCRYLMNDLLYDMISETYQDWWQLDFFYRKHHVDVNPSIFSGYFLLRFNQTI